MRKKSTVGTDLNKVLALIPDDRKCIADDLIKELQFMSETLEKLKQTIRETGEVELFVQGKQKFVRENPALKAYNTTIQRYGAMYKQLVDLIPKVRAAEGNDDDFDDFVSDRCD